MPPFNKNNENRRRAPFEGDPTPHELTQIAKHIKVADFADYNVDLSFERNYRPKLEQQAQAAAKFAVAQAAESRVPASAHTFEQSQPQPSQPGTEHEALARQLVENAILNQPAELTDV